MVHNIIFLHPQRIWVRYVTSIRTTVAHYGTWVVTHGTVTRAGGSDFRLYDGSDLKTYLLMRWWGPGALAVCRARRGLPVGFLLLRYSVWFAVESLSLLCLLVVS